MFFSDDLLTSKKGEFGIIWLAATLGPRTKRITRRQLTAIDLTKTCELIMEPPEPMALRLSGCLLVGVARVYNQNYELFYADVNKFHADLRRSVADLAVNVGGQVQSGGLDLSGDGKSRVEQITFTGNDENWLTGFDPAIDWLNPDSRHHRRRRNTSKLDSLPSQNPQIEEGDETDTEGSEDETESQLDIDINRRVSQPGSQTQTKRRAYERTPQPIEPCDFTEYNLELDIPPSSSVEPLPPVTDTDLQTYFPDDPMPEHVPTPEPLKRAREKSDTGSASEVEEMIVKKKSKVLKKVTLDSNLEIADEVFHDFRRNYIAYMEREGREQRAKETVKGFEQRAVVLVDGAGGHDFFDTEMHDFMSGIARVDKFVWEKRGGEKGGIDKSFVDAFVDFTIEMPEVTREMTPYNTYQLDVEVRPEVEEARNASQQTMRASQVDYPWDQDDDLPLGIDDSFTPGSRLSLLTPLEKKIRSSTKGSGSLARGRQRSDSVLTETRGRNAELLVADEPDDTQLPEITMSQLRDDLPDAFQPQMLAVLEIQCRNFFSFVEKRMLKDGKDELIFGEVVEERVASKHVAAGAFYNCLTLATKRILKVSQPHAWGDISFRFDL